MKDDEEMHTGLVVWFSGKKGMGFIQWFKDGVQKQDMFVYWSDLVMEGYKCLKKDQTVSFQIGKNLRGQDKAVNVKVIS